MFSLSRIYAWLGAAAAVILGVLAVFFKGKSAGKQEVRVEQLKTEVKTAKEANEVEKSVDQLSDAGLDAELRKHTRD